MSDQQDLLVFRSAALPIGTLRVVKMRAREALGHPYRIDLVSEAAAGEPLDIEVQKSLLGAAAHVAFGEDEQHPIHGVVREIRLLSTGPVRASYSMTLVPRLWLLSRRLRCRVFQDMTVPEIAEQLLTEAGLPAGQGFSMRLAAPHPKREYTVQYNESDLAFLTRLLEYEGMFYFFEQGEQSETVAFADSNMAFQEIQDFEELPFLPPGDALASGARGVRAIARRDRLVEQKVDVTDYNYRTPGVQLTASAAVGGGLFGVHSPYGEHVKTLEDGQRIAALRAEERGARRELYVLSADVPGMHPGVGFRLSEHDYEPLNQEYAVTEVRHSLDQAVGGAGAGKRGGYRTEVTAIPRSIPFRPRRKTPWPQLSGLLHARVDGSQKTSIDEHGRYKILLPFDSAAPGGGKASRWIRMAQPQAGAAGKFHFPLEVGTEVLLGHLGSDPDRPIIVAAVPNHATPSPVVAANAMQNIVRSRSGIRIILDDEPGPT